MYSIYHKCYRDTNEVSCFIVFLCIATRVVCIGLEWRGCVKDRLGRVACLRVGCAIVKRVGWAVSRCDEVERSSAVLKCERSSAASGLSGLPLRRV